MYKTTYASICKCFVFNCCGNFQKSFPFIVVYYKVVIKANQHIGTSGFP